MYTAPELPADFLEKTAQQLRENALIMGQPSASAAMPAYDAIPKEQEKPMIMTAAEGSGPFIILGCMYMVEGAVEMLAAGGPSKLSKNIAAVWLKAMAGMVSEMHHGLGTFTDLTFAVLTNWPEPGGATYGLHWVTHEDGRLIGLMCRVGLWLSVKGWRYCPDPNGPHLQFYEKEAWKPE